MSDFLGELASKMHELGLRGIPLEVVIAGSSTYEIDGAGTKWAPLKGTTKYDKDAFVIIRRKREVVSSEPMETFEPHHK